MNRELPYRQFSRLKAHLLTVGFTVYEYKHSQTSRIPYDRQVILTHDSFRDEAQCTIESVSRLSRSRFRGQTKFINASDVRLLSELQDGAGRPAIPQTTPSSAPQSAPGRAQASWAQQTNVALQQSISKAKYQRKSMQDVGGDVAPSRHKKSRSSLIENERKDSLIDADLLSPVNLRSGITCIQALLHLLSARPELISMNRAQIRPNPRSFVPS